MPDSAGPGRTSATAAIVSSSVRASSMRSRWRIAGDSSWKQLSVSPAARRSHVAGSGSGMRSTSSVGPSAACRGRASSTHSAIVLSARLPSRSILTSPIASIALISNWVTTSPKAARSSGT